MLKFLKIFAVPVYFLYISSSLAQVEDEKDELTAQQQPLPKKPIKKVILSS